MDKNGLKIIDFKKHNLHLVGYSTPLKKTLTKKDLFKNLYFLKSQPEAIPYITSYYKKRWGFCVSYNQFKQFDKKYSSKDKFQVFINSSLSSFFEAKEQDEIIWEKDTIEESKEDPIKLNAFTKSSTWRNRIILTRNICSPFQSTTGWSGR